MKRIVPCLLALIGLLTASVALGEAPTIFRVGDEEDVGALGRLTHIATDSARQPHIVTDIGGSAVNYFYNKNGGSWTSSSYNSGGSQSYNPHIEINDNNQAWVSVVKWYPQGMGMFVIDNMNTTPVVRKYSGTTGGTGGLPVSNLSIDPTVNNKAVVYGGNGGRFEKVLWNAGANEFAADGDPSVGTLDTGSGGEKNYFHISRAGNFQHGGGGGFPFGNHAVWHSCSDWSYNNSVRKSNNKLPIHWANFAVYTGMGDDGAYPCIVGDSKEPQTAYMSMDLTQFSGQGLVMNVWKGTSNTGDGYLVFSKNGLLVVDPVGTSGLRRYEPQLCPAKDGGVWVCYTAGGNIRVRYIPSDVTSSADIGPYKDFPGYRGAICEDNQGNLHVSYLNEGRVKYRKLEVSGVTLTSPTGRTSDRTPTFQWTVPEGTTAAMHYYWPKGQPGLTVSNDVTGVTTWTPSVDLDPDYYVWTVEATVSGQQVDGQAEFYVPPPAPALTTPQGWLDASQVRPNFDWDPSDGSDWYNVQVRMNHNDPNALGTTTLYDEWVQGPTTEWTPPADLAVGDYSWRARGFVAGANPIYGDWSGYNSFQLGAPGAATIVGPTDAIYTNDTPTFEWTMSTSDTTDVYTTWYQLFVIRDGRIINTTASGSGWFTEAQGQGASSLNIASNGNLSTSSDVGVLEPGKYGVWVRPYDGAYGSGPWSGAQATINRAMDPGTVDEDRGFGPTLPSGRPTFTWTGGPDTPEWYNVFIAKDGKEYADFWVQGTATWQPSQDLPQGAYRWWVSPYYLANGYQGPWLDGAAFQIDIPQLSDPLAPMGTGISATPTFTWTAADAADGYQIYYQKVGNPSSGVYVSTSGQAATTHTATALSPGNYKWWVSASNEYDQVWNDEGMTFTTP